MLNALHYSKQEIICCVCRVIEIYQLRWYNMDEKKHVNYVANKKEGEDMAVLAKPINRIAVIKRQEAQEFVREFNDNKVSKEFLESCKKAGKLFGKRK